MSVADKAMGGMLKSLLGVEPEQVMNMMRTMYEAALQAQERMVRIEQKLDALTLYTAHLGKRADTETLKIGCDL